jgi:hypothetical protein
MAKAKSYTVSDGRLVLNRAPAEEGRVCRDLALGPELITEAETVEEALANARDAAAALWASRRKLIRALAEV